jgi:hypothetical protein
VLNYHYMLGRPGSKIQNVLGPEGPCTDAQYAALVRLGTAADMMCGMSPLAFGSKDWGTELTKSVVTYNGVEVCKAEGLVIPRVAPTLPAAGVAGTLDIVPLLSGFTQEAILNPTRVRLSEGEIDDSWATPRLRMAEGECAEELLAELYRRGLLRIISPDEVWCHKGSPVTNGLLPSPSRRRM